MMPDKANEINDMWNRAFSTDREQHFLERLLKLKHVENDIKSKKIAECAEEGGWCQKLVDDMEKYYKNLINIIIPYIEEAITFTDDHTTQSKFKSLLHLLKSESYGK